MKKNLFGLEIGTTTFNQNKERLQCEIWRQKFLNWLLFVFMTLSVCSSFFGCGFYLGQEKTKKELTFISCLNKPN